VLAGALLTSACSQEAPASAAAPKTFDRVVADAHEGGASSDQLELLADGEATKDDIARAYENYARCVERVGMIMSEPAVNPVDGWRLTVDIDANGITDEGVAEQAQACQFGEVMFVDFAYEVTHEDEMAADLMTAVQGCMRDRSLETTGVERNMHDLLPDGSADEARAAAVQACINGTAFKLYPNAQLVMTF
jgi:hypothetical protein